MKFKKGDNLLCLMEIEVRPITPLEFGFAIYPNDVYIAESDSYFHNGEEIVELEANGDCEPCTAYPVKFFRKN